MAIRFFIFIALISIATALLAQPQRETLANGMSIITEATPQSPLCSLELWLNCSAGDEYVSNAAGNKIITPGLRRVLLYALLAASADGNWQNKVREITAEGGQITTRITPDALVIAVSVVAAEEKLALATLASIILQPQLSDVAINAAINQLKYEQSYISLGRLDAAEAMCNSLIFSADNAYSTTSYGNPTALRQLTPNLVRIFARDRVLPENTILSLATAGNLADSKAAIRTTFQSWARGKENIPRYGILPLPLNRVISETITSPEAGVMVVMSFPVCGIKRIDYMALQVLAVIMGNGAGARLYQHIREDRQLAYHVGAQLSQNIGANLLTLYAIGDELQQVELRQAFVAELADLHANLPNEEELSRAQGYLRGKLLYDSQYSAQVASRNALSLLAFLPDDHPFTLNEYEIVTLADLQRVIEHYCINYLLITSD